MVAGQDDRNHWFTFREFLISLPYLSLLNHYQVFIKSSP
jgi:hypothetical protein